MYEKLTWRQNPTARYLFANGINEHVSELYGCQSTAPYSSVVGRTCGMRHLLISSHLFVDNDHLRCRSPLVITVNSLPTCQLFIYGILALALEHFWKVTSIRRRSDFLGTEKLKGKGLQSVLLGTLHLIAKAVSRPSLHPMQPYSTAMQANSSHPGVIHL